ncbi:MAG TPA: hypothetical protein VHS35_11195 [Pseudonocardia sp.]|jgi:hypothetical protein|nr:hypothetical protein [Pseudonocardia sp.]
MGGLSEPPRGWDPDKDSLEDLVHAMFQDDPEEPDARSSAAAAPPQAAVADRPRRQAPPRSRLPAGRFAAPALAVAAVVTAGLAAGQILTATPAGPVPAAAPASPRTAARVAPPTPAAPAPVVVDFGKRTQLADGWRLAASRPYLCDVLMAVPVLQKDGTRIMRVTLTLTNRTGAPQATRPWRLTATADGAPAELVLWPAARFRGVPDTTLSAGRSVGFLVAFRVPEHPVQVRISAERDAAPGAVLAGTL